MLAREHVFDDGWVPEDLHARDGELQALAAALDDTTTSSTYTPPPVLLSGPPGTGKTASTRWVLQDLDRESRVSTALVDAWHHHKPYQTYGAILEEVGRPGVVQPQTPHSTIRARVRDAISDTDGVVVVLDEAGQLDDLGLVADLTGMTGVAVVLIVNDEQRFRDRLQRESVDLSFQACISYDAYGQDALVDILRPRARAGLHPGVYDEGVLYDVASLAGGNARAGIRGLQAAAEHAYQAGHDQITSRDVERGHDQALERIRRKTRSRLQRHERIVLQALEDLGQWVSKGEIYEAYESRVGHDARTRRRVGDYLSKLESYNLVDADGEKRGRTYRSIAPPTSH